MAKRVKQIWRGVSTLLLVLLVLLAAALVGVRLVGLRPFAVLSGSMEPTYPVGSLIYVKGCAPQDVGVGDAITFVLDENLTIATHRVTSIDGENQCFYTKGDHNEAPDGAPVAFQNLVGRPVLTIPYLGYFSNWLTTPPGRYWGIAAVAAFLILLFLPENLCRAERADARKREKLKKEGEPS